MAIRTLSGFQVGSKEPIDSRIVLTRQEMLGMSDSLMPDIYPAWCPQDGKMYVYKKENSKDVETGRFRVVESDGAELDIVGNAAVTNNAPALTSLKIGDTVYKINGGGGVCEYPDYLSTSHYIYKAKQSELTDCNLTQDSIAILFQQSDGVPAGSASVKKDDCYFAVHFCWEEYATAAKGNIALLINRQSVWNCDFGAVGADGKFSSQGIATGLYRIRPGDSVTIAISDYEFTYKDEYTEDPTLGISFHTIPVKYGTSGQGSGNSSFAFVPDYEHHAGGPTYYQRSAHQDVDFEGGDMIELQQIRSIVSGGETKKEFFISAKFSPSLTTSHSQGTFGVKINDRVVWSNPFSSVDQDGFTIDTGCYSPLFYVGTDDVVSLFVEDYIFTYKPEYSGDENSLYYQVDCYPVKSISGEGSGSGCGCAANPETNENTPVLNSITIGGQAYKIGGSGGAVKEVIDWDNYYVYHTKYNDQYYTVGGENIGINLCEKSKLKKAYSQTIDTPCYFTTVLRTDYSHIKSINGIYAVYVNNKPVAICDVPSLEEGFLPSSGMVRVEPDDEVHAMLYDATVEWEEGYEPPRELEMFDVCWYVYPVKYEAVEGQGGGSGSGTTVVANPENATGDETALTSIQIGDSIYQIINNGSGCEEIDYNTTNASYYVISNSIPQVNQSSSSIIFSRSNFQCVDTEGNRITSSECYVFPVVRFYGIKTFNGGIDVRYNGKTIWTQHIVIGEDKQILSLPTLWIRVHEGDVLSVHYAGYEFEYNDPVVDNSILIYTALPKAVSGGGSGSGSGSTVIANPNDATQSDPAITSIKIDGQNYKIEGGGSTPDMSNYIEKSQTTGLVKNDGTIDTTQYQTALNGTNIFTPDVYQETEWGDQELKPEYDPLPDYLDYEGALSLYEQVLHPDDVMWDFTYPIDATIGSGVRKIWDCLTTKSYVDRKIAASIPSPTDLTNYVQKSQTAGLLKNDGTVDTNTYLTEHQDISGKVDKVEGKGLSTEDFTSELKFKLENMSEHGEENMIDAIEFNGESVPVSNKVAQITYTPPVRPEFAYTIMNYDENDQYTIARTKHNCGSHPFIWCWSGNNLVQASVVDNVDGDITVKWNSASLVTPENPLYVFFMNLNCEIGVEPKTKYRLDEIPYLAFVDNSTADNKIGAVGKNSTTNTTCPPDLVIPTKVIDNGIEYTVTKINSFASMTRLKSVEIPDTVTSYTNRNFQGCSNLEEVRLSTSNTGIQFAMFQECSKLRTINLDHITNIQDQAFLQCENLEMDDIPPLCTKIGNSAFTNCYKIGPILHIPRTMTSISAGAFGYNPQLTAVYIPDNGLSLGQNVFRSCENVQIYCEATEKPSNWNANCFQYIDEATQVHYGCTLDY